jgi:hypothetical protein
LLSSSATITIAAATAVTTSARLHGMAAVACGFFATSVNTVVRGRGRSRLPSKPSLNIVVPPLVAVQPLPRRRPCVAPLPTRPLDAAS